MKRDDVREWLAYASLPTLAAHLDDLADELLARQLKAVGGVLKAGAELLRMRYYGSDGTRPDRAALDAAAERARETIRENRPS